MNKVYLLPWAMVLSMPTFAYQVGDVVNLPLADLKPTQPSIGYDQVMYKLGRYQFDQKKQFDEICEASGQKGLKHYSDTSVPGVPSSFECEQEVGANKKDMKTVVLAPNGDVYLTDGHHTFNTFTHMQGGGLNYRVNVLVDKDYRDLDNMPQFWDAMIKDGNTWQYDLNGEPITPADLPTRLGMSNFDNDLYRSLMYFSRDVSWNKPKNPVPFLEFYCSKELRQLTDASQYDLASLTGYQFAIEDVAKHLLSIDSDNIGGSGKSASEMGLFKQFSDKGLKKLSKSKGKLDYMLRYKTVQSGHGLAYDATTITPASLSLVDSFTLQQKRSFNDYPVVSADGSINAIVEIPTGTSAKWELNKDNDKQIIWELKNDAPRIVNYLGYPGNYGTLPQTALPKELGGDGDPLDVLVLGQAIPRGQVVNVRLIGILKMLDDGEQDDKLIAVLTQDSPFSEIQTIAQLNQEFIGVSDIVKIWFESYKGKDGGMQVTGWGEADQAMQVLQQAKASYATLAQ
ncbi:inorganic diphosphatase [Vibrio hippocampi]|uniref:inorganic diphosphatase n=1 Tax=Vibrio hippocampi TaxID=654686 RepID=A0ABN8DJ95_9VIBR|nr:inorganic diphosphatase [Vibrio hippocampi]CAH0529281.1 Inorganic pyrophosphatase [Vibrio hippocampi]